MSAKFTHVHVHSHYSLLEALPKIPELVVTAKADGQTALALTDNGNMYAAIDFYKECKAQGMKPIFGVDFFVSPRTRHDKELKTDEHHSRLILLAKNETGYRNLIELVSLSHLEGFFYRPRIDRDLMEKYREGLIAILPAYAGEAARAVKDGARDRAEESYQWYKKTFSDDCYVQITMHPEIEGHDALMKKIADAAEKAALPLVAGHEVYYMNPEDNVARELVVNIRNGTAMNRDYSSTYDFSFISQEQAGTLFKNFPAAMENTQKIADRCNVELELGKWVFPDFPIPPGSSHDNELRAMAYAGFTERGLSQTAELVERTDYELSVISKKGYSPYFLVVSDLLRHARDVGIYTNTRGSAAGSLVSYLCGITTVNPIEYQLPFERFLNPERPSPPDIDMDLADNKRDQLISYVRAKYGEDHVAQIGTFGTMMARAAVRDVSRALGHSYGTGDRIAKLIPFGKQGFPVTIDGALESTPDLLQAYKKDPDAREILDLARKIEGNARHVGVHAAGVVISPKPVTAYTPIQRDPKSENANEGKIITQYDMYAVEEAGLLKFDFLGLTNLSVLADSVQRVRERLGTAVDLEKIPLDDTRTFEMLARGETLGVFQMASGGMTNHLVDLKPSSIHDINAMVALYRPGPMNFIPEYIQRKHDASKIRYLDPRMKDILAKSYGVITYQDDVLMIAIKLAGYSWLEADKFRKAIGKKIPEEMAAQKERFTKGCIQGGMKPSVVDALWQQIETFAAYGFNKCLTADTQILDAKTGAWTNIQELIETKKAPHVLALSESLFLSSAKASRPFENGVKKVYKLVTRSGRSIRATDNHPFRVFDGWLTLKDLRPGTRIATPRIIPEPEHPKPLDSYRAATLGYLISEGNLCHPHGVYFYSKQKNEVDDFIRHALKFKNSRISLDHSKSATSVYVGQQNQKLGSELRTWLDELGVRGKTATQKFIPWVIFNAPNKAVAIFLGKLWQGDGCVSISNQQTFYATSSEHLARDVQRALLRFGIVSTVHAKQFKYRDTLKPGWTITICGERNLRAFAESIGKHLIGRKEEDLHTLLSRASVRANNKGRGTADTVPSHVYTLVRSEMARSGFSTKEAAVRANVSERVLGYDARKKGYTRATLAKIADALDSSLLKTYAESHVFWDEVVSIEPDGQEMTYDLSVPGPANFVANGLIVHNSHAASYGNLAYKTAYMKANYPVDYMAAVLTADAGDVEKISDIVAECKRMKLTVEPPSVNKSRETFSVINDATIAFGLVSIKNFGAGVSDSIIVERDANGPYTSLADFLLRVSDKNLNKKSLEALIMAGALDEFGDRATFLANIEKLLSYHKESSSAPTDQGSLFGGGQEIAVSRELPLESAAPATQEQKLTWEKELLGFYVSGHPLDKHADKLAKQKMQLREAVEKFPRGLETVIGGFLESTQPILTKKGDRMLFGRLSDFSGGVEIVVFPKTLAENASLFVPGACIAVKGKFSNRNGEASFVVDRAKAL